MPRRRSHCSGSRPWRAAATTTPAPTRRTASPTRRRRRHSRHRRPQRRRPNTTAAIPTTTESPFTYEATIRRTAHNIPHITADDFGSLGFGYGYAFAEDHLCSLADVVVQARSEAASFFGAGTDDVWLEQDLVYKALDLYERAAADLDATDPEPRAVIEGYAAGYNRYLADTGVDAVNGYCAGEPWVRPIDEYDLAAYYKSLSWRASVDPLLGYIASATPPASPDETDDSGTGVDEAAAGAPDRRLGAGARRARPGRGPARQQRLGDRSRSHRRRHHDARRQPTLPVAGCAAVLRGAPHRARRARRVRRVTARLARDQHRVHRRRRLVGHGVGRAPVHGLHARPRTGRPDALPLRRRRAGDDEPHGQRRRARRRRHDERGRADVLVQPLRTDHRLPRPRMDRSADAHVPRRQRRQRRVDPPVHGDEPGPVDGRLDRRSRHVAGHPVGQHDRRVSRRADLVRRHVGDARTCPTRRSPRGAPTSRPTRSPRSPSTTASSCSTAATRSSSGSTTRTRATPASCRSTRCPSSNAATSCSTPTTRSGSSTPTSCSAATPPPTGSSRRLSRTGHG